MNSNLNQHLGEVLWVETLRWNSDKFGYQHEHRGVCGIENEITTVKEVTPATSKTPATKAVDPLAQTGNGEGELRTAQMIALTLLVLAGSSFLMARNFRNSRNRN